LLPSSLLVVRKRKGEIQPRYANLFSDNLEAANRLIEAYRAHIGEKKKVLKAVVVDLKTADTSIVLLGRCVCCLTEKARSLATAKLTLLI